MSSTGDSTLSREETLVQYVLVRRDLQTSLGWPLGSVIAQGCHAVSALMWEQRENSNVAQYCANIDSMHKVLLVPLHPLPHSVLMHACCLTRSFFVSHCSRPTTLPLTLALTFARRWCWASRTVKSCSSLPRS
jgi:hypothetical protein